MNRKCVYNEIKTHSYAHKVKFMLDCTLFVIPSSSTNAFKMLIFKQFNNSRNYVNAYVSILNHKVQAPKITKKAAYVDFRQNKSGAKIWTEETITFAT